MSWKKDVIDARIEVLEEHGYTHFNWHIDSKDAYSRQSDTSAPALIGNVLDHTDDMEHIIILMHDFRWRDSTLEALPEIIGGLRDRGYTFDIMSNYPGE